MDGGAFDIERGDGGRGDKADAFFRVFLQVFDKGGLAGACLSLNKDVVVGMFNPVEQLALGKVQGIKVADGLGHGLERVDFAGEGVRGCCRGGKRGGLCGCRGSMTEGCGERGAVGSDVFFLRHGCPVVRVLF